MNLPVIPYFKAAGSSKSRNIGSVKTFVTLTDLGDDLETVAHTNVPPGRLAFRRDVLGEEQRLMMLSTRRSRANTADSWFDTPENAESTSWNALQNGGANRPLSKILGLSQGLRNMEDGGGQKETESVALA